MEQLNTLVVDGVVEEVLGQLKSGKEAEVWLVRASGELVAAKVYKERQHRSFRNNADYKEGRLVRNTRTQRAMARGSRFGQQAAEDAWKAAESDALHTLHAAGVRVPKPVLYYEGVLLMDVVVDAEGHVAPRLVDVALTRESAAGLYEVLRGEVVKMLCQDLVHGDLSEFNVLLAWNGPTIIDFPQVISAPANSRAEYFFRRDLENLRRFFGALDPAVAARHGDAEEIWRAWTRRELTPDFVPSGRAAAPRREFTPGAPRQQEGRRNDAGGGGRRRGRGKKRQAQGRGPEVAYRGAPPPPSSAKGQGPGVASRGAPPPPSGAKGGGGPPRQGGGPPPTHPRREGGPPPSGGGKPHGGHRRRPKRHF